MARVTRLEAEQSKQAVKGCAMAKRYPTRSPAEYLEFVTFAARFSAGQPAIKRPFITKGEHWKL
jgi:hypothetical protein